MRRDMQDEGDMIAGGKIYTPWGIAWRLAVTAAVIYVVLVAVLVLIPHA